MRTESTTAIKRHNFLLIAVAVATGFVLSGFPAPALAGGSTATGPLRVHPENPRYFADGSGKAIYLTGSHTWNALVDKGPTDPPPEFDFEAYLDFLDLHGHNFTKLWTWEQVRWNRKKDPQMQWAAPQPWARTGPGKDLDGKPRFDLTRFNSDYFQRLRSRVIECRERGIYVSVMLFEGWGAQFTLNSCEGHPFHRDNNVNDVHVDSNNDGKGFEVYTLGDRRITALQEGYVRKVIDTVNDLDNVLFEISNENHPISTEWQYHMIDFVHDYEKHKPKQHPVGMTFQYRGGSNQTLLDSPADWISPNREGGYRDDPPAADGSKVILVDTDHLGGVWGNQAWVWKSFLRGLNPIFMDPYKRPGSAKWDAPRRSMGQTLSFASRLDLSACVPHNALASTEYCLANPGKEYLVYLPSGGKVSIDLSAAKGVLAVEWFELNTGKATKAAMISGGGRRELKAPFDGHAVLYLVRYTGQ